MGLFVQINAFRGVGHADVETALTEFRSRHAADERVDVFDLYEQRDGWTVMRGWEWTRQRQAQLHVSAALGCAGILVFVYDGDDWGYELFDRGTAVDWFIQWPQEGNTWFPGKDLSGRPEAVVAAFPGLALDRSDVAPYLAQRPDDPAGEDAWDVPARAGDRFCRGDDYAALDFLALLGVTIAVTGQGLDWPAPLWRRFRAEPPPST
ncbi:hypothetical protein [Dactylosporangium sp. NPDC049140]|uniref:hypothetical protein n=1 Tax=Dactylosporangium sp. NPDC049140 TaxID=3155647 RepID=UPI00341176C3